MKCFAVVCQFMYIFSTGRRTCTKAKKDRWTERQRIFVEHLCALFVCECVLLRLCVSCCSAFCSLHFSCFLLIYECTSSLTPLTSNVIRSMPIHVIYIPIIMQSRIAQTIVQFSLHRHTHTHTHKYTHWTGQH